MDETPVQQRKTGSLKKWLPLGVLAFGLAAFFAFDLDRFVSFEALGENREVLRDWLASHPILTRLAYVAAYTVSIAFSLPVGLLLTITGGFLFGLVEGTILTVVGATIGASAVFVAAKTALGDTLRERAGPFVNKLSEGFRENALSYLLILRLVPLFPFWLVNIVPALVGVSMRTFIIGTFVGIIPGTFVFVSVGNGLDALIESGQTPGAGVFLQPSIYFPIIGLTLLSLIPVVYKRFKAAKSEASRLRRTGGVPEKKGRGVCSAEKELRPMTETIDVDLCVIGAGAAGLSVAAGASQMGAKVALFEKGEMGGDCLNVGCVPSKALLSAAHAAHVVRDASRFGVDAEITAIDWQRVKAHVKAAIKTIEPVDSQERYEGFGVRVIRKHARFVGPRAVAADSIRVNAKYFVIATGSRPAVPPIKGLDTVPYLTNEAIFDLDARPDHLIVLGGGPIGSELAQAHARLGSKVTIVEAASLLGLDDPEAADVVRQSMKADGIDIREGSKAVEAAQTPDGGIMLTLETADGGTDTITGSHLLVAVGRKVSFDGLDVEKAGIALDERGRLKLDAGFGRQIHVCLPLGMLLAARNSPILPAPMPEH